MFGRTILVGSSLAVASLAMAACGGGAGAGADPDDPVAIGVTVLAPSEMYVVPWLVAQDQGFFTDRGVEVTDIVAGKGGSQTLRTQLAGDIPIGEVGFRSVAEANAQGVDVFAVGGGFQSSSGLDFYALAGNDDVSDIPSIDTWAFTNPGSSIEALSYLIPEEGGIDDSDDERVAAGGVGEGIALLESGEVDVAVVPPSVVSQNKGKFKLVVRSSDIVPRFQQSVLTTTEEYASENPDVVEAVVAGYQEAAEWIPDHVDEAAALYAAHNDLPQDAAKTVVADAVAADGWGAGFNSESINHALEAMEATGFEGEVDECSLFVPDYLPDGVSSSITDEC